MLHFIVESIDGRSTNSSSTPTAQVRDRSHTEGSNSIELEWDHDDGRHACYAADKCTDNTVLGFKHVACIYITKFVLGEIHFLTVI